MNGNIRTCYEYYSSIGNEEMKAKYNNTFDPGTKNNPYALEDALDWCNIPSCVDTQDSVKMFPYFEVVKDIDMNDCNVQTIDSCKIANEKFNFKEIEGNGHSIRNLSAILQNIVSSNSFMMGITANGATLIINNLNFINIIRYDSFTSLFSNNNTGMSLKFNNCNFTVYDFNRNGSKTYESSRCRFGVLTDSNSIRCTFNYCTFNIKTSLMFYSDFSHPNSPKSSQNIFNDFPSNVYNYCHINIEYMHGINPSALINPGTYNFSYITLTINYLGQDDTTGNNAYNLFSTYNYNYYYLRGSYIYIKFKSNSTINNPYLKFGTSTIPTASAISNFDKVIKNVSIPSFITIEDENKDDLDKAVNIDELTKFTPADISDEGVYAIGSESSVLFYLTPENAKNYDILSKIDFPCLQI